MQELSRGRRVGGREDISRLWCAVRAAIRLSTSSLPVCEHRPPQDNPKTLNTQLYIQLYEKKLARFRQFAALYPECYWLFVGDNGQVRACLLLTACPLR